MKARKKIQLKRLNKDLSSAGFTWHLASYALAPQTPAKVDSKIVAAANKVPLDLVPLAALKGPARVYGYGSKKHGAGNYYNAVLEDGAAARYAGGMLRHLSRIQEPNGLFTAKSLAVLDEESGLPEIDHLICGLLMLRTIATKCGALPEDPGVGKEPPK